MKKNNTSEKSSILPSYNHHEQQQQQMHQNQRQTRLFVLKKKRVNFPDESNKINDLLINNANNGQYKCCTMTMNQTNGSNGNAAKVIVIDTLPGMN